MKTTLVAAGAFALSIALTDAAPAADTASLQPIVLHDKLTVKATVAAIDRANRTVALRGPEGNVMTLVVDESVTRFDKLKMGDTVTAQYYESVAYQILKPGTPAPPDTITDGGGKFVGDKLGGAVVSKSVRTVTIETIDLATPAVTVKSSDGTIASYRVRHKEYLTDVKVGDQVTIRQTAALMIAVDAQP
jgi:ribosomal protein S17